MFKTVCKFYLMFCHMQSAYYKEGDRLFTEPDSDGTRDSDFKLKEVKFRLSVREKFFTQ